MAARGIDTQLYEVLGVSPGASDGDIKKVSLLTTIQNTIFMV